MNLSVVILTKNEEKNILDCLESVKGANEVVIIDDYSEDRTLEVIKKYDKRI
jgi:glycosyltransferase involved in cell wall biosynthesis